MFMFVFKSKYLSDIIIDGTLVFNDYIEYMYDTKEYTSFDDLEEYRDYIIENLQEYKYDIIEFMYNNFKVDELIPDDSGDGVFIELNINKGRYVDTITDIMVRFIMEY